MDTTSKAAPRSGHKHPPSTREQRGLALYRERASEIAETSPGTYRVPGSDGAEYTVRLDVGYCSCPDRTANCKHLFAVTVCAAKKRCRRAARPTQQPARRHDGRTERPRDDRRDTARPSDAPRRRGGSHGLDPAKVRANLERMGG